MKTGLHIGIQKPCGEDFHAMPQTKEGRYCGVCDKNVIDFSAKTDRELLDYFRTNPIRNSCGMFRPDQLNRNIILPEQAPVVRWKAILLSVAAFIAARTTFAEAPATGTDLYQKEILTDTPKPGGTVLTIGGVVKSKNGDPLKEAFISYQGQKGFIAFTNAEGRFSVKVNASRFKDGKLNLKISRAGYLPFYITLQQPKSHNLTIVLKPGAKAPSTYLPVVEAVSYKEPLIGGGIGASSAIGWEDETECLPPAVEPERIKFFPRLWQNIKKPFRSSKH